VQTVLQPSSSGKQLNSKLCFSKQLMHCSDVMTLCYHRYRTAMMQQEAAQTALVVLPHLHHVQLGLTSLGALSAHQRLSLLLLLPLTLLLLVVALLLLVVALLLLLLALLLLRQWR
jgi:hypothetical protein